MQYCFVPDRINRAGQWQINTPLRWTGQTLEPHHHDDPVVLHFYNRSAHRVVLDYYINGQWMKSEKRSVAPGEHQVSSQWYMEHGTQVRARAVMTNVVVGQRQLESGSQEWFLS
jgi:hypothetical protein